MAGQTLMVVWSPFCYFFYRHWSLLVLRNSNGTASFMHSKEVVTQGGSLAMISYGIGILPLINNLKWEIPDITHPWYADKYGALGTFARLETYFHLLTLQGPGQEYYPKPPKSVLIIRPKNLETGKAFRAV